MSHLKVECSAFNKKLVQVTLTFAVNPYQDEAFIHFILGIILLRTRDISLYP